MASQNASTCAPAERDDGRRVDLLGRPNAGAPPRKGAPVSELPSKAALARRWPALLNRYTGKWVDDASGAKGDDLRSLLAYLDKGV